MTNETPICPSCGAPVQVVVGRIGELRTETHGVGSFGTSRVIATRVRRTRPGRFWACTGCEEASEF